MNDIEKLIMGIDLGNSCLRAAVGKRNEQGMIELLALKRINGYTGMRGALCIMLNRLLPIYNKPVKSGNWLRRHHRNS